MQQINEKHMLGLVKITREKQNKQFGAPIAIYVSVCVSIFIGNRNVLLL